MKTGHFEFVYPATPKKFRKGNNKGGKYVFCDKIKFNVYIRHGTNPYILIISKGKCVFLSSYRFLIVLLFIKFSQSASENA